MNTTALSLTLLAVLCFGVWGFFMKLGQERLGAMPHLMGMGVTTVVVVVIAVLSRQFPLPPMRPDVMWLPVVATVATLLAMLFLVLALAKAQGQTAGVVALSALYPGVTAILAAIYLGEGFTPAKVGGLVCAALAAYLFTR